METIVFFYRSTHGDLSKRKENSRPPFFSKLSCLRSFIRAVDKLSCDYKIFFCNDTPIPNDRLELMGKYGEVINMSHLGNGGSQRFIFKLAKNQRSELIYFAEDDYLYIDTAFVSAVNTMFILNNIDYFTLYDHPDRYKNLRSDPRTKSRIYLTNESHWRVTSSTCMSYGCRTKTFKKDFLKHYIFTIGVDRNDSLAKRIFNRLITMFQYYSWDQSMWHCIQGIKPYYFVFPKRRLISPIPSLASHMEKSTLAPFIEWANISRQGEI
ncbi:MAG: hypothetical protein JXC36_09380 [Candidatus Atribacteria bacterium]|nr:hypothetical protein [Candidatus Atribacteria bacterium]